MIKLISVLTIIISVLRPKNEQNHRFCSFISFMNFFNALKNSRRIHVTLEGGSRWFDSVRLYFPSMRMNSGSASSNFTPYQCSGSSCVSSMHFKVYSAAIEAAS